MTSRTLVGVAPNERICSLGLRPPPLPEADSPGCGDLVGLAPQESIGSLGSCPPLLPEVGSPAPLASRPDHLLVGSLRCL